MDIINNKIISILVLLLACNFIYAKDYIVKTANIEGENSITDAFKKLSSKDSVYENIIFRIPIEDPDQEMVIDLSSLKRSLQLTVNREIGIYTRNYNGNPIKFVFENKLKNKALNSIFIFDIIGNKNLYVEDLCITQCKNTLNTSLIDVRFNKKKSKVRKAINAFRKRKVKTPSVWFEKLNVSSCSSDFILNIFNNHNRLSRVFIADAVISKNSSLGCIYSNSSELELIGSKISLNETTYPLITLNNSSTLKVVNSEIYSNKSIFSPISLENSSNFEVIDSEISSNATTEYSFIFLDASSSLIVDETSDISLNSYGCSNRASKVSLKDEVSEFPVTESSYYE